MAGIDTENVLKRLEELWASTGKKAAAEEPTAVLRACSLNLIVVTSPGRDTVVGSLAELTRQHPSRSIILRLRPGQETAIDTQADVICWLPFEKRQQICSEQIRVDCAVGGLAGLQPLVGGLLAPDLPVVLWYDDSDRAGSLSLDRIDRLADKIIVDGREFADPEDAVRIIELGRERAGLVGDLAWTALTGWRELVAKAYAQPDAVDQLNTLRRIRVQYREESAAWTAVLLVSWIVSSLGGTVEGSSVLLQGQALKIEVRPGDSDRLDLGGEDWQVQLERSAQGHARLTCDGAESCTRLPVDDPAVLVGQELAILGPDPVFEKTFGLARLLAPQF